jgi:chorismate dehydratase
LQQTDKKTLMFHAPEPPSSSRSAAAALKRAEPTTAVRVGAVQYLNTRPLIYGLSGNLDFDLPSRLADRLAVGELDVALIPSIELFRGLANPQDTYRIVSQSCIACRGPVMSVRLFFRTRPERTRRLAVDEGSRTSVALCRILLHERFGIEPALETLPLHATAAASNADAVLLIGDRAIAPTGGGFQAVWDLGDEWYRWTGLPFVFAVWAARPGFANPWLSERLDAAREHGRANLAAIAAAEAGPHGLTVPQCLDYLQDNLHYDLGKTERQGLRLFHEKATRLNLAPTGCSLDSAFTSSLPLAPGTR